MKDTLHKYKKVILSVALLSLPSVVLLIIFVGTLSSSNRALTDNFTITDDSLGNLDSGFEGQGIVGDSKSKIFYGEESNIFSYDFDKDTTLQLTQFRDKPHIYSLQIINEEYLGFVKCIGGNISELEAKCTLNTLNLEDNSINIIYQPNTKEKFKFSGVSFQSLNKFVATVEDEDSTRSFIWDKGVITNFENLNSLTMGRGPGFDDYGGTFFSPDGKHFATLSTISARSPNDFNIYIRDSDTGKLIHTIKDATHPSWINNDQLLFQEFIWTGSAKRSVKIFNLNTQTFEDVPGTQDSSFPKISNDKGSFLFMYERDQTLWKYELESKTKTKLFDNAITGEWVSNKLIIYYKTGPCGEGFCFGDPPFDLVSIVLVDLSTGKSIEMDFSGKNLVAF